MEELGERTPRGAQLLYFGVEQLVVSHDVGLEAQRGHRPEDLVRILGPRMDKSKEYMEFIDVHWGDVPGHAASKADDSKGKDEAGPPGETGPAMPAPA